MKLTPFQLLKIYKRNARVAIGFILAAIALLLSGLV